MAEIIGVRFKDVGKIYYFDPEKHTISKGTKVVVETARGIECGEVAMANREVPEEQIVRPLKNIIRLATQEDLDKIESNKALEETARQLCARKIIEHKLDMKLVGVEYAFDSAKVLFYYTSEQRVDFRALVKDLAGQFRTRIEMRQIGVRDESKMIGGLGICGRPFCCNSFLGEFQPVSIKMAKEQNLSLNPIKISGCCGRLMCCLKYEQDAYEYLLKITPRHGALVETTSGRGIVRDVNLLKGILKVQLDSAPETPPQAFLLQDIKLLRDGKAKCDKKSFSATKE